MRKVIGHFDPDKPIHIYGAGISGLLMGHYLLKAGHKNFTLFEKSGQAGGKLSSIPSSLGIVETAANAIFTSDLIYELMDELKLEVLNSRSKLKKKIFRQGKVKSFPFYLGEFFNILLRFPKAKVPPMQNYENYSVQEFFTPLLGAQGTEEILGVVLSGIYAEKACYVHVASLFPIKESDKQNIQTYPQFFKAVKKARGANKTKAMSISFKGGMQEFINALSNELKDHIHYNSNKPLDPYANNILCTEAYHAADILANDYPMIAEKLRQINYLDVTTTTFFSKYPLKELEKSFGVLFPYQKERQIIGLLHNTAIFPHRSQKEGVYSYTAIARNNQEMTKDLLAEMYDKLGQSDFGLIEKYTTTWAKGIPRYDFARFETIQSLRKDSNGPHWPKGLVLFGNYIDGISIREMAQMAKSSVEKNL